MLTSVIHGVMVICRPASENEIGWPENGITAKATIAGITAMHGASQKTSLSAFSGTMSSLIMSFRTSAIGWSRPCGPTRRGPSRTCMKAMILRSSSVR